MLGAIPQRAADARIVSPSASDSPNDSQRSLWQTRQRRAGERAECLPADLAPIAAQTARLAPRDRTATAAVRTAPLFVHAEFDRRQRGRALRPSRQRRRDLLALCRRQIVHMRKPVPKPLVIHLPDLPNESGTILQSCL